jgi:two-component system, cell cycle response regulator
MSDEAPKLTRILVVDDSRIVRATIIKRIRDRFDAREEADGEAAWETLLVDPEIHFVISDLTMPRLDGYGLLERIRSSKVPRIRNMPVIMISGDEDENARQRAKDLGASDFITKGTGTAELLARLDSVVNLVHTQENLVEARSQAVIDKPSGLLTPLVLERNAEQALSYIRRHSGAASVLIIGFDRLDAVVASFGSETADALLVQFSKLLVGAVRKEDSLARWSHSELAVVTPGVDTAQAKIFSDRIRDAVARASITLRGQQIKVTVTVGIASAPADQIADALALLALAKQRMVQGQAAGGNRVVCGDERAPARARVDEALARIAGGDKTFKRSQLARLGLWMLPLLRIIDKEFHLGLPLVDIERRLAAPQDD